jgi:hypothetical protein
MAKLMPKPLAEIFGLISVRIGLSGSTTIACSCLAGSPNEHLQIADVVFAGKAIAEGIGVRIASMVFKVHEQTHSTR